MGYHVPAARNFSSRSSASVGISLHRAGDIHFTLGRPLPDPFHERRGAAVHLSACATATP
jgi:hypothetical protein